MPKPNYILSFATDADGDQVFIHADAGGLDHLISTLARIRRKLDENICDHDHLMTDAWGGHELSEPTMQNDERLVHQVKIYGWTPEWIEKHHFKI
jgi:hypothetical protein